MTSSEESIDKKEARGVDLFNSDNENQSNDDSQSKPNEKENVKALQDLQNILFQEPNNNNQYNDKSQNKKIEKDNNSLTLNTFKENLVNLHSSQNIKPKATMMNVIFCNEEQENQNNRIKNGTFNSENSLHELEDFKNKRESANYNNISTEKEEYISKAKNDEEDSKINIEDLMKQIGEKTNANQDDNIWNSFDDEEDPIIQNKELPYPQNSFNSKIVYENKHKHKQNDNNYNNHIKINEQFKNKPIKSNNSKNKLKENNIIQREENQIYNIKKRKEKIKEEKDSLNQNPITDNIQEINQNEQIQIDDIIEIKELEILNIKNPKENSQLNKTFNINIPPNENILQGSINTKTIISGCQGLNKRNVQSNKLTHKKAISQICKSSKVKETPINDKDSYTQSFSIKSKENEQEEENEAVNNQSPTLKSIPEFSTYQKEKPTIGNIINPFFLCPFCNKNTPLITSISSQQNKDTNSFDDIISTLCECGDNSTYLINYINSIDKKTPIINGNCYNSRHKEKEGVAYCEKCHKFLCDSCLLYHYDYLPKHITSPYKIPTYSNCTEHPYEHIIEYCINCKCGSCAKCTKHLDHNKLTIEEYWNVIYNKLPFKDMEQCIEFTSSCIKISEKQKDKYINYIDEFIDKLKKFKEQIKEEYIKGNNRLYAQAKLVQFAFGNFTSFRKNYNQIENMNTVSFICPSVYLLQDSNLLKVLQGYKDFIKKATMIEMTKGALISRSEFENIFEKYPMKANVNDDKGIQRNNKVNKEIQMSQSECKENGFVPKYYKAFNTKGVYYGECSKKKRHGRGIQFNNNGDVYEGYWKNGDIIKGVIRYANGNKYEGNIKNEKEEGYGVKKYKNGEVYKGVFKEGRKISQSNIQNILETKNNNFHI